MLRHFAYFAAASIRQVIDGVLIDVCPYIREWKGEVAAPPDFILHLEDMPLRQRALTGWMEDVAGRAPHEICLDVTSFDYPEGDFCWMVYRPYEETEPGKRGLLDWPDSHTFVQIDRATMRLQAYWQSVRPVRSTPQTMVIDVTGTPWERIYIERGALYGTFRVINGHPAFVPDVFAQRTLDAASHVLDPVARRGAHADILAR